MERPPEELLLSDSYQFSVTVESGGSCFVGELRLSPSGCSLVIRGDLSEGRSANFGWQDIDQITCNGFDGIFHLYGLKFSGGGSRWVQRHPKPVVHFENRYRVSHVIFSRANIFRHPTFVGFDFHSPSVAQWVGYTRMQDEIVSKYHDGTLFPYSSDSFAEFSQPVEGLGDVAVRYYPSTQYSASDFSMGLRFAPVLSLTLDVAVSGPKIIEIVSEIDTLFSFLFGARLDLDKIALIALDGRMLPISLYFPRALDKSGEQRYPFFPLGINLRTDQMGLPSLPTELFSTYFCLPRAERLRFSKYIRYRNLENPEERFLGFFRLLEKLCFQKESFLPDEKLDSLLVRVKPLLVKYFDDKKNVERVLGRMPGWNNSKLNTEACVIKFLRTLPASLRKRWIYDASDIQEICRLRNDLTHANAVEPDPGDIEKKAKFIEVLLVTRLLIAVGVSVESAAAIAPRLPGHALAERPAEVRITTGGR
ncbi:hypothetical protein [Burkholderia ubonensis]|uniref:ApeA N-terminal domain 1-containing protein n=1 Tax=Burkholderia ubonensis TaxID=101571 RepID=UPI000AA01382|nr:hypothetical protein [Burkholderia ubonensis]